MQNNKHFRHSGCFVSVLLRFQSVLAQNEFGYTLRGHTCINSNSFEGNKLYSKFNINKKRASNVFQLCLTYIMSKRYCIDMIVKKEVEDKKYGWNTFNRMFPEKKITNQLTGR